MIDLDELQRMDAAVLEQIRPPRNQGELWLNSVVTILGAAPQLIAIARAAEKVARFEWGGDAQRTAAMGELRAALEGVSFPLDIK